MTQRSDGKVLYWLWLSLICTPGSSFGETLLNAFDGDARRVYNAEPGEYADIEGITPKLLELLSIKALDEADGILRWCTSNGVAVIYPGHPAYSRRLFRIRNKPLVLYFKGTLPDMDDNVCVATVGTRRMTEYGNRSAYTVSYDLARCGAVIVSGMASGIDSACHRGCLDAGGSTVAVLGCGIDRVYPAENEALMREITRHGAVVTEYRPFTPPNGKNFPIRNRIISGLSQATLVIEADVGSGALITAREALLQGRDVFAMPGKVGEANSSGTNQLIKDGARIVTNALDILSEYSELYSHRIRLENLPFIRSKRFKGPFLKKNKAPEPDRRFYIDYDAYASSRKRAEKRGAGRKTEIAASSSLGAPNASVGAPGASHARTSGESVAQKSEAQASAPERREPPADISGIELEVYNLLSESEGMTPDVIAERGLPINEVLAALTMLELKGAARALPGGLFVRI